MTKDTTRPGEGRTILVIAATGRQGQAVVRNLLAEGWQVRGLTRNPASPAAQALAAKGVEMLAGDLDQPDSLLPAMAGAHGVYSLQDFWETGLAREIAQGKAVADAALFCGVSHLVYASVGGAERTAGLGITHFEGKTQIEAHIRAIGLPATVLRPVSFFENFITPRYIKAMVDKGVFRFPFPGGRSFQMVALDDIGRLAARSFADPDRFIGHAIEVASDAPTMEEFASACGAAIGRAVQFRELPLPLMDMVFGLIALAGKSAHYKVGPSIAAQARWSRTSPTGGWNADFALLDDILPDRMTAASWASSFDWHGLRKALDA